MVQKYEKYELGCLDVKYSRKPGKYNRKELSLHRNLKKVTPGLSHSLGEFEIDFNNRIEKSIKERLAWVKSTINRMRVLRESDQPHLEIGLEWKEQVARVGTGYRVRKDEKDVRKRRFDVGYADLKSYKRKDGRDAVIDASNMGRSLIAKGKDARVKVINAVCEMEKRRPVSEYTGSGILRKSIVGKLKLKPTKPSGKE
jgi:hypothetical protein